MKFAPNTISPEAGPILVLSLCLNGFPDNHHYR